MHIGFMTILTFKSSPKGSWQLFSVWSKCYTFLAILTIPEEKEVTVLNYFN